MNEFSARNPAHTREEYRQLFVGIMLQTGLNQPLNEIDALTLYGEILNQV